MRELAAARAARRVCAIILILAVLASPVAAAAPAPVYIKVSTPLECALYLNSRMSGGLAEAYIEIPAGIDAEAFYLESYSYLRMLYSDYCALYRSWLESPRYSQINITMQGAESGRSEAEAKARSVAAEIIKDGYTQVEKLAAIHDYVISHCEYDYAAEKDPASAPRSAFSAYGMLINGKGVCDAYSAAFALICKYAGVPCMYFLSSEMTHSWNVVLLGGKLYFIDTTYNDTGDVSDPREYFLLTPEQLRAKGHKWDEKLLRRVTDYVWDAEFQAANSLSALGLFKGTDAGFELERMPTRAEGSVMLLRLMGLEGIAAQEGATLDCPFTDVTGFYRPYIAYMRDKGLAQGTSRTEFSPGADLGLQQYLTFVLRALGYDDRAGDFEWSRALDAAVSFRVLSKSDAAFVSSGGFDRGMMAYISLRAVFAPDKSGSKLANSLILRGVISSSVFAEIEKYS